VAILIGAVFGAMQLQPVKDRIAVELQEQFNKKYEGVISIGDIRGILPFQMELYDVKVYPDSATFIPVVQTLKVNASLDIWSLFQKRLVVNALQIEEPTAVFDRKSGFSAEQAFIVKPTGEESSAGESDFTKEFGFQLIIPSAKINNGYLVIRHAFKPGNSFVHSDSLQISDLHMDMFFEFTEEQRFIDMNEVSFNASEGLLNRVEIFGQIYNDDQFLEFNAINLKAGNSSIRFSGEADGVNVLDGKLAEQLVKAPLSVNVEKLSLEPAYFEEVFPSEIHTPSHFTGSFVASGKLDSLQISRAQLGLGDSFANLKGYLKGLNSSGSLHYGINVDALILGKDEVQAFAPMLTSPQLEALTSTRYEGELMGIGQEVQTTMLATGPRGEIKVSGSFKQVAQTSVDFTFSTDSLDLGYLIDSRIQKTNLSLDGEFKSSSFDFKKAEGGLVIKSGKGMLDNRNFEQVSILAKWQDGFIEPNIRANFGGSIVTTTGWIDLKNELPEFSLQGKAGQIQLNKLIQNKNMNPIRADIEYDMDVIGRDLNTLYGQVSLDITQAVAGSDTLDRHQLYVDINAPDEPNRVLRFTSTAFDANIQGDFNPADLLALSSQWEQYFEQSLRKELLFKQVQPQLDSSRVIKNQSLTVHARLKNLGLITHYFPGFPVIASGAKINSTVNVSSERLLFNSTFSDTKTASGVFNVDSLVIQTTGGFRRDAALKDFSGLQIQAHAAELAYGSIQAKGVEINTNLNQDSLHIRSSIKKLANDASFTFQAEGSISDNALKLYIETFDLGTNTYHWQNRNIPMLKYQPDERLVLKNFQFDSDSQFVEINGVFSKALEDSVNYNIGNVNLQKISDMIGGRIGFGGIMDGRFTTRTLTTVPTIQGDVDVEKLTLDGSIFGDVEIRSRFNQELNRFDTHLSVTTDSTKYPEYFANNDRRGQQFDIDGYVLAPKEGNFPKVDSLFQFDVDFKNIDLWILPLIGPKVFEEGAGLATGTGLIWGNLETYDFNADFMVGAEDAAYLRPKFLETYYYAQGRLSFTRFQGLTFKDIYLIDPSGGSAILSGYYNFNDFGPVDSMNISLAMDEFQFLNSSFDPTVAFYGKAYGSSTVTISGSNLNPILRSEQPIVVTDFSEISIPLLEETDFNEDNRFIRFVDSFDEDDIQKGTQTPNGRNRPKSNDIEAQQDLTFAERFTLDLQFVANNPMTVQLIFDPVTGDIVTAEGTGRLRILLEDEQVSMFGRFDILGGRYQFVSGDIFTRKFKLESGGTITWEGDPANAKLDLNAIYSARPDINTLSSGGKRDPENSQRVPIDLVLNIGGTITSIENDFYFRLPNTFESQQNSTLSTQLASINRDDDLKLLQAANFMLMGDFIPVSSTGEAQNNLFGDNLSGSAAVLNPLISSQVINPLLSNQVNSLLNSDLSSLDVDFNLNTYNQVDLGVALRLYNDKLILRREGQITGRQSNIGDLGATYRINKTFAVTAFHRQDLTFGTISSTEQSQQSQDINGLGLEAKVSFNTWDEFFNRLFSPFRKFFGKKDKNQEDLTENRPGQDPT
jgi:hypothetical protein